MRHLRRQQIRSGPAPLFEFESRDAGSQFMLGLATLMFGELVWQILGGWALVILLLVTVILIPGLRASIEVYPNQVKVVRRWFFLPYRMYQAPYIERVWFDGD